MRELTYGWNLEMQMRAARAGVRVLEVPVDYRNRLGGTSKVAGACAAQSGLARKSSATFRARGDGVCSAIRDHDSPGVICL